MLIIFTATRGLCCQEGKARNKVRIISESTRCNDAVNKKISINLIGYNCAHFNLNASRTARKAANSCNIQCNLNLPSPQGGDTNSSGISPVIYLT